MNELVTINNGQPVTNSLLVAEKFEKGHKHVLDSVRNLVAENSAAKSYFLEAEYENRGKQYPMYIMNRDGFSLLVMGFTGEKALQFKIEYIEAFGKMESMLSSDDYILQRSQEILQNRIQMLEKQNEQHKQQIQLDAPKVLFAESFKTSDTLILMNDLAKLLNQNGIDIGERRLYDWMVKNHYLICNKRWSKSKQRYNNDYMPTQRAADLKVFFVIERPIPTDPGEPPMIKHTVKVTGKGQIYFINKFLKNVGNYDKAG